MKRGKGAYRGKKSRTPTQAVKEGKQGGGGHKNMQSHNTPMPSTHPIHAQLTLEHIDIGGWERGGVT